MCRPSGMSRGRGLFRWIRRPIRRSLSPDLACSARDKLSMSPSPRHFCMRRRIALGVLRCAVSTGLSIILVIGATRLRHVNHTTVALALVLLIPRAVYEVGVDGGLGRLHLREAWHWIFVLPSHGFSLEAPEQRGRIGRVSPDCHCNRPAFGAAELPPDRGRKTPRRNRSAVQARERCSGRGEFGDGSPDRSGHIVEILPAREAAFFDRKSGQLFRSGAASGMIPDERLREVADTGEVFVNADQGTYTAPGQVVEVHYVGVSWSPGNSSTPPGTAVTPSSSPSARAR